MKKKIYDDFDQCPICKKFIPIDDFFYFEATPARQSPSICDDCMAQSIEDDWNAMMALPPDDDPYWDDLDD